MTQQPESLSSICKQVQTVIGISYCTGRSQLKQYQMQKIATVIIIIFKKKDKIISGPFLKIQLPDPDLMANLSVIPLRPSSIIVGL